MPRNRLAPFRRRLLYWFTKHGRDLPWRRTRDPYKILVSEVMLQQTQVDRVKDYYARFLRRYPSVEKLARARSHTVREQWEGLGYYRRAENLHRASKAVVKEYGGKFPRCADALQQLPGIGRYTAGAVASFAFEQPAPILDTNVSRVLRRVYGVEGEPLTAAVQKQLWSLAEDLVQGTKKVWHVNQAVMDFGATVCTARAPKCSQCPMQSLCVEYSRAADPGANSRSSSNSNVTAG